MIEGSFIPMSEREDELMEELFVATREAHSDGVPKVRIASMLAYMAAGACDPAETERETVSERPNTQDLEERLSEDDDTEPAICPVCKDSGRLSEIQDVKTQMGGQLFVEPCGCQVEWDNREILGEWLEDIEDGITSSSPSE
ncbi:hypothetical protein DNAM5_131 [Haloarcula californiae tailed virus 1]|uniref:Uncharacterized protein n=1 Tax=Haloarcula californiae tailed virus 1 TaxID=1273746 RepID=R4T890_9CAUD|nr:hypothetical protein M202_gp089 [Haloarcula californiae tailed virus 1]AGM11989.1 hypothetical protein DNAM5_131 [Haloarcula californiae tailed virus 1]